jgi:hypothetical protein
MRAPLARPFEPAGWLQLPSSHSTPHTAALRRATDPNRHVAWAGRGTLRDPARVIQATF